MALGGTHRTARSVHGSAPTWNKEYSRTATQRSSSGGSFAQALAGATERQSAPFLPLGGGAPPMLASPSLTSLFFQSGMLQTGALAQAPSSPAQSSHSQTGLVPTWLPGLAGAPGGPSRPPLAASVQTAAAPEADLLRLPNDVGPIVAEAAERYGVEPALIAAVIEVESGFNPNAGSPAGAKGLMQLMDGTARGLGVTSSYDPRQNVLGGTKFLGQLLDKYRGDLKLALAAYNAGPGAVDRHGGIPPFQETQRYVPKVLAALEKYRRSSG